jgi:hypothetical protein
MLKDRKHIKTIFILTIFFVLNGQFSVSQNIIKDTIAFNGAKTFIQYVLKTLEPQGNKRNEDSICRTFVPTDTILSRLNYSVLHPENYLNLNKYPEYRLSTNSPVFSQYNYRLDSACSRPIEKNVYYFRVNCTFKNYNVHGRESDTFYLWYKIWFDGKKYWLIPGHHYTDVTIDFAWTTYNNQFYTKGMAPWK